MGTAGKGAARDAVEEDLAIFRAGVQEVQRVTHTDIAMGGLVHGDKVALSCFTGTRTAALRNLQIRAGTGLGGQAMAAKRPVAVSDYLAETRITHDYDPYVAVEGMRSILSVPVIIDDEVVGLLYAAVRKPVGIGDRTTSCVTAAARHIAQELTIRREVSRRITAAGHLDDAMPARVAGSDLEEVRAVHAQLRALAATIDQDPLRAQLDAVSARLAGVVHRRPPTGPSPHLTDREVDVLAQIALGCTNAEAAVRLDVGAETVKAHLRSASRKLIVHTRHEAVAAARRAGYLP